MAPFGVGWLSSPPSSEGVVEVRLPWGRLFAPQGAGIVRASAAAEEADSSTGSSAPTSVSAAAPAASAAELASRAASLVSPSSVPVVSSICLAAAATKAKELSLDEERKLLRCVAQLLQAQMRRVELKLAHLTQLDAYVSFKQHDVQQHYLRLVQHAQAQTQTTQTTQAGAGQSQSQPLSDAGSADGGGESTSASAMQTDSARASEVAATASADGAAAPMVRMQA